MAAAVGLAYVIPEARVVRPVPLRNKVAIRAGAPAVIMGKAAAVMASEQMLLALAEAEAAVVIKRV